jgi:hypothetical protein
MTKVWSWEEQDYIGDDDEPRLLPDLYIEPGTPCEYCGQTEEASGKNLAVQCSQCGGVAHFHCAVDCAPYDTSDEYNDWVCGKCLNWTPEDAAKHAASLAPVPLGQGAAVATIDDDFDDLP